MSEQTTKIDDSPLVEGSADEEKELPGIIVELGQLPPGAVVTEAGLAKIFHRHQVSVRRAVDRGELPVPTRLFGRQVWTAEAIRAHLSKRLEAAARDSEQAARRISKLS